jgi:hypothetical protein
MSCAPAGCEHRLEFAINEVPGVATTGVVRRKPWEVEDRLWERIEPLIPLLPA